MFGSFEKLEEYLSSYVKCADMSELYTKIFTRWSSDYSCPEKDSLVSETLLFLAVARKGVSESELQGK